MAYYCILDFEATCEQDNPRFDNEIIEFPSVIWPSGAEFQQYCRPNKPPGEYCTNLTGITQETTDAGDDFPAALVAHTKWLAQNAMGAIIVTCGHWDLRDQLPRECKRHRIVPPKQYMRYINIQDEFARYYKQKAGGMANMLRHLELPLEGRHHSGIDDCRNIMRIWQRMIADGYDPADAVINYVDISRYKK